MVRGSGRFGIPDSKFEIRDDSGFQIRNSRFGHGKEARPPQLGRVPFSHSIVRSFFRSVLIGFRDSRRFEIPVSKFEFRDARRFGIPDSKFEIRDSTLKRGETRRGNGNWARTAQPVNRSRVRSIQDLKVEVH